MEISIKLLVMWQNAKVWIIFYPDLFMEISIDLLVMWLKVYIWDLILFRPVYGNFHKAVIDVANSLSMGSYFIQTSSWKFP